MPDQKATSRPMFREFFRQDNACCNLSLIMCWTASWLLLRFMCDKAMKLLMLLLQALELFQQQSNLQEFKRFKTLQKKLHRFRIEELTRNDRTTSFCNFLIWRCRMLSAGSGRSPMWHNRLSVAIPCVELLSRLTSVINRLH